MTDDLISNEQSSSGWTGHWWVPNRPETKLPGVLYPYREGGPELELVGSFKKENDNKLSPLVLLHGCTASAEFVTLHNCRLIRWTTAMHKQDRAVYQVELVAAGSHFPSVESLVFQTLRLAFSTLVPWLSLPLIEREGSDSWPPTFKVRNPIRVLMCEGTDFALTLFYAPTTKITGGGVMVDIHPDAHVILQWAAPRTFSDSMSVAQGIRDFLTLATGSCTEIESIAFEPLREQHIGFPHYFRLFHKSVQRARGGERSFVPLFLYGDVAPILVNVLGSWFAKAEVLRPVVDLYLSPVYSPQIGDDNQFLAAIQALEALHRRTRNRPDLQEDLHRVRVLELVRSSPRQYRKWLVGKLRYSNEQTLRDRMKSIFLEFDDILAAFKLDRKNLIHQACVTRNYLTHYDPRLATKSAKGSQLYRLTAHLRMLLEVCLLHELGIPRTSISQLIKKRPVLFP